MKNLKNPCFWSRGAGAVVIGSLLVPVVAGCGAPAPQQNTSNAPAARNASNNGGLSTRQKVTLLAGAAALYYVYNRYKNQNQARLANQNVQYYLSKNGRVYYRDPKNPQNVVWVTPPPAQQRPIQIPESEALNYREFQGFNNAQNGRTLRDVFPVR